MNFPDAGCLSRARRNRAVLAFVARQTRLIANFDHSDLKFALDVGAATEEHARLFPTVAPP